MAVFKIYFRFLDTFEDLISDDFALRTIDDTDDGVYVRVPPSSPDIVAGPFSDREAALRHLWTRIEQSRVDDVHAEENRANYNKRGDDASDKERGDDTIVKRQRKSSTPTPNST
eukprot:5624978-Prymnesium_polylepis.1